MNKAITIVVIGVVLLAATPSIAADKKAKAAVITPCVVITGADSRVAKQGYRRITSTKEWTAIWQQHKGKVQDKEYDRYFNPLGIPLVDFKKCMVIAIFQGSGWNSAGLRAVSISQEPGRIVFRFDDKSYQTGRHGKSVNVYGFFIVPRSSQPVILEENVQREINKPPVWKERIKLPKLEEPERSNKNGAQESFP